MLDAFEILTTSGIVLWRKTYSPVSSNVVNSLINDVFIEDRSILQKEGGRSYRKDKYTLKWDVAKDAGLVFVAVYQSLLQLSWVENLIDAVKALFLKQYANELKQPNLTRLPNTGTNFNPTFDALVRKLDTGSASAARRPSELDSDAPGEFTPPSSTASNHEEAIDEPPPPPMPGQAAKKPGLDRHVSARTQEIIDDVGTSTEATPVQTPDTSRPSTPVGATHLLTAKSPPGGKTSRRARKAAAALVGSTPASSGDEGSGRQPPRSAPKGKSKRRWDASGQLVDVDDDDVQLDYSATATGDDAVDGEREMAGGMDVNTVRASDMGSRTNKGQFVLKDLDDEVEAILASQKAQREATKPTKNAQPQDRDATTAPDSLLGAATSRISGMFRNVVGGKKLSPQDLVQPLAQIQSHLLQKNVAREAADRLVRSVEADLLNSTTSSFTSVEATIRESMSRALTKILTPTTSLDLLRSITSTIEGPNARPYVISIVGVNGVGKSTSLSKIAYFLLQNNFRVVVVAADTFRSGAVEQLGVHVDNLSKLAKRESIGSIALFQKGYGRDAATVARDAIVSVGKGSTMTADVVLIDTAGRRHNDTRLMSSLTNFGRLANPDKIFMVGEALVGTDAVAQARNFSKEFVDEKGALRSGGKGMDGFIVSKCDTVGDMVGVLVSMVFATGIPVVFLGVGQHYGDLRGLNVGWAVDKLMK
ncbi:P-loop containing nucleoside triphosphate hydrolase protein [Polychaeton citri CBS 116435]|uniref:Signal recognition particle receptor subunit alpha homolog n=1 Tax=Polychaeton citri CBS 116435 TaxID=1314669 RepID=A0A9P4Q9P6_9PEZI|nr:P-loop containing nucleoside triphosphate hydrolase protein [Polychaeton citri CBS 116435]